MREQPVAVAVDAPAAPAPVLLPAGEEPVAEIVARTVGVDEQAELPQLVGDVLAGVGDGAVGAHQDLVRVVHVGELGAVGQGHHPAARVLARVLEADRAGLP